MNDRLTSYKQDFTNKLLQHDVTQHNWNEINSTFEKPNHIVSHHVVKFVCKPNIFQKKKKLN
jgi:hypothetical protein